MLYLLFGLFAGAQEPAMTITVTDSIYDEVYMEDPRVICDPNCSWEQDTSEIFIEANLKHRTWLRTGKIAAIYNDETIKFSDYDCDFKRHTFKCGAEEGLWVLKTTITQDKERASINLMLFNEQAVLIGQSTFTRFKKTRVIERKKVSQQQVPGQPMSISSCNKDSGSCATIPVAAGGQTVSQTEDLEPTIIEIPPMITSRDVGQAMIMLYDSVVLR